MTAQFILYATKNESFFNAKNLTLRKPEKIIHSFLIWWRYKFFPLWMKFVTKMVFNEKKLYCKNNYRYFWQNPIPTDYWTHLMNIKPKNTNNRTHELKFVVKIIILVNKIKTTNDNSKIVNICCHCCVR